MQVIKTIFKWIGRTILLVISVIVLGYTYIYISTEKRLNKKYRFSETRLAIPSDSQSIEKGKHLYQIRSCGDCHGTSLQGGIFMNDPLLLQISAPNLTKGKGGLSPEYSSRDWIRVLRHGVDKNGKSLWMMPAHESNTLNKDDLANLIAYCQSVPPRNNQLRKLKSIGPIGRVLMKIDRVAVLPAEHINHALPISANPPATVYETGKYLASTCQSCHMHDMKGGSALAPGFPPVPDISAKGAAGRWTEAEFIKTIRSGKTPEGKILRKEYMPWQNMQSFTNEELAAIYTFSKSIH